MIPIPTRFDLMLGCAALGAAQLAVAVRFLLRLRAGLRKNPPPPGPRPRVAVFLPCAGTNPLLETGARALLSQDYPGSAEFLFVTPSREDPAFAALSGIAAGSGKRVRVLASGRAPERSSGKIVDLLFAIEEASPEAEIFVFADADLRVPDGWLSEMAGALDDPRAGVATAAMLYVPKDAALGAFLRMLWMGAGIPYFELTGGVTGQSAAIRRADFSALGVAELWSRSLLEDLALAARVRGWDKEVRFVWKAVPWAEEGGSWGEMLGVFNKWMTCYRVYDPGVWLLGAAVTAFKAYVLLRSAFPAPDPGLFALLFGIDAASLFLVFGGLGAAYPDRFRMLAPVFRPLPLVAAAAAPLLQLVYLLNYLHSAAARTVVWGPYSYRIRGPQDVSASRRDA